MPMVKARQVADHLGISVSTVGRALSDDRRISAETKLRVREAADALGYVGNVPARMMRGQSSKLVGLVLPNIQDTFYSTIAQTLSECFDREGFHVALSITGDDRDVEARHVRDLVSARVAGIVIIPTATPRRETALALDNVPHVQLVRRSTALRSDWFGIDDAECIRSGTRHLLDLGHRRIAYIGGATELATHAERLRGFRQAFIDLGIETTSSIEIVGKTTVEAGMEMTRQVLEGESPPSALISGAVRITLGMIEAIGERQVSVPDKLSIVGFGDPAWFKWWGPGLTTLRMPVQEVAVSCGLWFLHGLRTNRRPAASHNSVAHPTLVLRGSTAPP